MNVIKKPAEIVVECTECHVWLEVESSELEFINANKGGFEPAVMLTCINCNTKIRANPMALPYALYNTEVHKILDKYIDGLASSVRDEFASAPRKSGMKK